MELPLLLGLGLPAYLYIGVYVAAAFIRSAGDGKFEMTDASDYALFGFLVLIGPPLAPVALALYGIGRVFAHTVEDKTRCKNCSALQKEDG